MSKRKITKASKRRLSFFGTASVVAIIYFIFSLLYNTYTIYNLVKEKNILEKSYISLQEEAEQLKTDIEKFNDPNYLANYAREHYLYSKDGEYIIQMEINDTEDQINSISSEVTKNYIVFGLSLIMLLIFIYILLKGKRNKKKTKKKKEL